ncbi:MAG: hypothetical protein HLUCCA11_10225 [Phormidesmis priestleyi Ana]|uniref:Uncharacterized protein n=1 Tax=Phormidesmis priestleyi Ana TaxID=1666911 RepID=A0A0P7YZ32_9CYAN|nr:MAG: hypothetical protein HLUCCA11_10225 [Phormidesmis priestleyi Ana]
MNKLLHFGRLDTVFLNTGFTTVGIQAGLVLASVWLGFSSAAYALPGQSVREAEAWMQAHPTLRADPRERLTIRRNDTPARRFTFHGSIYGPGGAGQSLLVRGRANEQNGQLTMVRSEKFTLVDLISGVSVERLEDALRTLYGAEVYADYRRSQTVLVYSPGRPEDRGTHRASRAQVSEGDLYAYIIEIIPNPDGSIHTGTVSVMLKEDVPALRAALRDRELERREFADPTSGPSAAQERIQPEAIKPR